MKDADFNKLAKFKGVNEVALPLNANAQELCLSGDFYVIPATNRDLKFHACYFAFCNWLWMELPTRFKLERCQNRADMYKYLKIITGDYELRMTYKGKEFHEFKSISFSKMKNEEFEAYVNDQLIALYENILVPLKRDDIYDKAVNEFKRLFAELI